MKQLRKLREKNKLTQAELAEKLNLSSSTIAMYERGERKPDIETLKQIATYFKVSIDYLLDNIPPNQKQDTNLSPSYVALDRVVKNMPEKDIEQVLNFAKYINLKGKDRLPNDDDDF